MNLKSIKQSALCATGAAAYIAIVAAIMTFTGNNSAMVAYPFLGITTFLLLFVLSAAVMGILIFGAPVMLFLENKKKESVTLLFTTVGFLAIYLLLAAIILAVL